MSYSFFDAVEQAPSDAIFKLNAAFGKDPRPHKANLTMGVYRDENLLTPILQTVKTAENYLLSHEITKEYLPIEGDPLFIQESGRLIFGDSFWSNSHARISGIHAPGGTGALRLGADLLREGITPTIAIPDPTWPNHPHIFQKSGFKLHLFSYYDMQRHQLNFQSILETLQKIPSRSVVLLHGCCHNPTGADPTPQEWEKIADILRQRELLPFFDFAYQGFGKGIEEDAHVIRTFAHQSLECVVAASYSKNFGLYSERVGTLFVITRSSETAQRVLSKLKVIARTCYSNPPRHGGAVVGYILSHPELKKEWMKEVDAMRHRLTTLRKEFVRALQEGQKKRDFSYLLNRLGMFCYLGLDKEQVLKLQEEHGIYIADNGRINLAGLSSQNFNYIIGSILKIL